MERPAVSPGAFLFRQTPPFARTILWIVPPAGIFGERGKWIACFILFLQIS
ncbi:hypothetical protein SAMN04488026_1001141 [Aliiruegeria lutimaris]|uniref:Uncharacterized protein n=1 Tax=Aliiruegeria lutimaris TaxID=571298 RepID=A0A1G8IVC3_9RHOB|nr:hypothetical protein SAMN04488026_1001141 [Aliiruegeria lutimaris]